VQAALWDLVNCYEGIEHVDEAGKHIVFALDERFTLWKVYQ
jgi:hypothetical protein